jgi:hypothetical protein
MNNGRLNNTTRPRLQPTLVLNIGITYVLNIYTAMLVTKIHFMYMLSI